MRTIGGKRCIIGEGPIWNEKEGQLYFVNGLENEICSWKPQTGALTVRSVPVGASAIAFDKKNRMIVSRTDGVFILNPDDTTEPLYDTGKYRFDYANDMKVGPDGRIYVGTQSTGRLGLSDRFDGKLFSIDRQGNVRTLLTDLALSNGMDCSMDETRFYHTDSDKNVIREYEFDKDSGEIRYTGREVTVPGVDGFTIDRRDRIISAAGVWLSLRDRHQNYGNHREGSRSDIRSGKLHFPGGKYGRLGGRNSHLRRRSCQRRRCRSYLSGKTAHRRQAAVFIRIKRGNDKIDKRDDHGHKTLRRPRRRRHTYHGVF